MTVEDVRRTYNAIGLRIMEAMYSDDYLSIGGSASTDELAAAAGIRADHRVLDVGSGLGGPALRLAETIGCRVQGIDLVDLNVAEAGRRADERGLVDLVDFTEGDASAMPFDDASFDVVWGQDAWCHVIDKVALVAECARVAAPGATIAFTDWLVTGEMGPDERATVLTAAASSEMATAADYRRLLATHGFTDIDETDLSGLFADQYRAIYGRLPELETELADAFGGDVFEFVLELNGSIEQAFTDGKIGGARFIARR